VLVEVQLHVPVNVGVAALAEAPPPGAAGVVDQQVEATAVLGLEMGADPPRRVGVGEVGGDDGRRAGQRVRQPAQQLLAAGDQDQLGARLAGQPDRRRLADSSRCPGHQCDAHRATVFDRPGKPS
jgi:hypothetical protein